MLERPLGTSQRTTRTARATVALGIALVLGLGWYAVQRSAEDGFAGWGSWFVAQSDKLFGIEPEVALTSELRGANSVVMAVRTLARLETLSFHMERVIDLKDSQSHAFGMLTTQDAILLVAAGDVVAGVDLTKLRDGDIEVDPAKQRVRLRVPPAEVFSVRLDSARTYVHSRQTSLFMRPALDLEARARQEAELVIKRAALDAGLLTRAGANAEQTLSALVHSLGYSHVELVEHE